jgi:hypothetical protein
MDLKDVGCEGVDWIYLAEDRRHWQAVLNTVLTKFFLPEILKLSCRSSFVLCDVAFECDSFCVVL